MQAQEDDLEEETTPLPPLLYVPPEAELPRELLDRILNLTIGPTTRPLALARIAGVNPYLHTFAQPFIVRARLVDVANAVAFQGAMRVLSSNNDFAGIATGLRQWMFLPEMQANLLQTLLLCPVGPQLHNSCARVVVRIMHRYPHDVEVQRAAAQFLVRKNLHIVTGPYMHQENGYDDDTVPCDEAVALCTAMELFGNDELVCKLALQSLSKLAESWLAAYIRNPTSPEYWGRSQPLAAIFGLANGRRNRIVLNAMRCIERWNPTQHTSGASEIIAFACKVLECTLQGEVLLSAVPGGPPGVACLLGVDKMVLEVLLHNKVQNMGIMHFVQRMAWKRAKESAALVLKRLVEAKRLSINHNIPARLTQLAIDGDVVGLDIMTVYCTNVARQKEFLACGFPFWVWIDSMMSKDFVAAPDPDARKDLERFLGFLTVLGHDNDAILCELMMQTVPQRLCQVLITLQSLVGNEVLHKRLRPMKQCIIVLLSTFFSCPGMQRHCQELKKLFSPSLTEYIAESMCMPSQPESSTLTAVHCMCVLSKLMPSYVGQYSPPLDAMFKKAVSWMDTDPNNLALIASAMSLLCVIQVDTRSHVLNFAIIHALSGLYKFASDVDVSSACVHFLHRLSLESLEVKNILWLNMRCQVELFMLPPASLNAPTDLDITPSKIRPNEFLRLLARSDMPHLVGYLAQLMLEIIRVTG